jgi:putative membrane protein
MSDKTKISLGLASLFLVLVWSAIRPHDYFTWFLEVLPALMGVGILAAIYPHFKFTNLAYALVWIQSAILMIGGHYTYARMPLFDWIRDTFGLMRNNYDKVGHFAQGFVPAIIIREVLLRASPLKRGKLLSFVVVSICMAFSALWELFEWQVAVALGPRTTDFLGTQGDVWDTQEDMAACLIGSTLAVLLLGRLHDKFLEKFTEPRAE